MKNIIKTMVLGYFSLLAPYLFGQSSDNCFLVDYEQKTFEQPKSENITMPEGNPSVLITINDESIGKVSKYVFGNAIVAWGGSYTNADFVKGVTHLQPSLIRWPGGSWADGWFLDKIPTDVPDSIYDGTKWNGVSAPKMKWYGNHGKEGGWKTTTDQYYKLRETTGVSEGLITVNYGYARYGTSLDPVAQAAHEAARWVRYDAGRTKFWEIGNENGGPWEYGWMIDTAENQDGQPTFITGELYGKHFKVFADSMKTAANEIGATIYIGGQVIAAPPGSGGQWGIGEKGWNEGFFREVGDSADFYVVHNYFDNSYNVNSSVTGAIKSLTTNADYVESEIAKNNAFSKPVTLTEYNGSPGNENGTTSYVNGIQAVVLICEMIQNNFGLGARWELGGMFSGEGEYANHPHADFYYLHYLQKIYGDLVITTSSSNKDVVSYATKYSATGDVALVVINKGDSDQMLTVSLPATGVGQKYYLYTFSGGTDSDYSKDVIINGRGPNIFHRGPFDELSDLKAWAYTIDDQIKIASPAKSVQMVMIEGGTNVIIADSSDITHVESESSSAFRLDQNHPNPFSSTTIIEYQLPVESFVSLKVFDINQRQILTLVNEHQKAGKNSVEFNASSLPKGVYFYRIDAGKFSDAKKLIIVN